MRTLLLKILNSAFLVVVPRDFQEAVERAEQDLVKGRAMLALLAEEAKRNPWSRQGVRLVALEERRRKIFKSAQDLLGIHSK